MKRKVALAAVLVSLLAVFVAPSPAQAHHTCTRPSIDNSEVGWMNFSPMFEWHYTDWFRITSHCAQNVLWSSRGWRFEARECGHVWLMIVKSDGTVGPLSGGRKFVCGGDPAEVIASGQPVGRQFRIHFQQVDEQDWESHLWPMGSARF